MISITLNFKTIEAARQALLEIPASALVGGPEPEAVAAPAPAPKPARAAKAAQASTPAPEPVAAPAPVTAQPVEAPAPVAAPAPAEPAAPVQYADLQRAVLALYKVDKSRTQQIAIDMGFESFKVMPAERWAEALANVNAALGV